MLGLLPPMPSVDSSKLFSQWSLFILSTWLYNYCFTALTEINKYVNIPVNQNQEVIDNI